MKLAKIMAHKVQTTVAANNTTITATTTAVVRSENVKRIKFGIASDADLLAISIGKIDKPTFICEYGSVYDPRLGCVQNGMSCETCGGDIWTCPGHVGHIDLTIPIILYHKQTATMLKCFCVKCSRILATREELVAGGVYKSYEKTVLFLSNLSACGYCKTPVPEIRFSISDYTINASYKLKQKRVTKELTPCDIKAIFDMISDCDVETLGLNCTMSHPRNLIKTKFIVIPTCCRPKMMAGDNVCDDDLSIMLVDIIKSNAYILSHPYEEIKTDDDRLAYEKAVQIIKSRTLAYCDNSRGRVTHNTNHKPMTGIKERINRKTGLVRQNLSGKRCNRTARTVIGPDPTLKIDELAVPKEIANTLTRPEIVNHMNIEFLTKLVNSDNGAVSIIRSGEGIINVPRARIQKGTKLEHGDIILRGKSKIPVMDCRMVLMPGDSVLKPNGTITACTIQSVKNIELKIGDVVERYLRDGDPVYLNRQPTLHRNGMLGMRAVIKPGRTLRFNLSITKGLNADFDGDEGNMFVCETLESMAELLHVVNVKEHMLSAQINKPEQVLVQDSLLAAYLMTYRQQKMTRADFMNCLLRTNKYGDFKSSSQQDDFVAADLFSYILPADFCFKSANIEIEDGRIKSGFFDKTTLGSTKNSIIRLLCMEYGKEIAADFIDNIQFVTNAWLEINPFSIGISDCLMMNDERRAEIAAANTKYFLEASAVSKSTSNKLIREMRINMSLNKAKDIGLRIAKEALREDNNFISTVTSGSKGDFFNIAQITGLLGQQNLSSQRPRPTLNNNSRTLVHYPFVITQPEQQYESRGFVSSCFLHGMNPREMWFHAMAGREGIINTALKTASSGYIQRSCDKLNEDLKIEYDGTVRDASGGIHQFIYGNHGYDPANVTFNDNDDNYPEPVDIFRLARRLRSGNKHAPIKKLSCDEIEEIITAARWSCEIPQEIYNSVAVKRERNLREALQRIDGIPSTCFQEFKKYIVDKYHTSRSVPGDCVGIISAQSIGEVQTQSNLNTFHTAGKLQSLGAERFEEILNVPKVAKCPSMNVYFKKRYTSALELRNDVGCTIVGLTLDNVTSSFNININDDDGESNDLLPIIRFNLKKSIIHSVRLSPDTICNAIAATYSDCINCCEPQFMAVEIHLKVPLDYGQVKEIVNELKKIQVCGISGIKCMHIEKDCNDEFYVITEGSNLKQMLRHPLVDIKRLYTNDILETYDCLGIAKTRNMLLNDIKKCVASVNTCHIQLLVDKMTFLGRPASITRYTMKHNAVGPISKATFEQSVDILLDAAFKSDVDHINGVSSAIVTGNRVRIGTGMPNILIDYNKIINNTTPSENFEPITTYYY